MRTALVVCVSASFLLAAKATARQVAGETGAWRLTGDYKAPTLPEPPATRTLTAEEQVRAVLDGSGDLEKVLTLLKSGDNRLIEIVAGRAFTPAGQGSWPNCTALSLLLAIDHPGAQQWVRDALKSLHHSQQMSGRLLALKPPPMGFVESLLADDDAELRACGVKILGALPGSRPRLLELVGNPHAAAVEREAAAIAVISSPNVTLEEADAAISFAETLSSEQLRQTQGLIGSITSYIGRCPSEQLARRAALTPFQMGVSFGSPYDFDRWTKLRDRWASPHLRRLTAHASEIRTRGSAWERLAYLEGPSMLDEFFATNEQHSASWTSVVVAAAEGTRDARALSLAKAKLSNHPDLAKVPGDAEAVDVIIRVSGKFAQEELGPLAGQLLARQRRELQWYEQEWTPEKAVTAAREHGLSGKYGVLDGSDAARADQWLEPSRKRLVAELCARKIVQELNSGGTSVLDGEWLERLAAMSGGELKIEWCRKHRELVWNAPVDAVTFGANGGVFKAQVGTKRVWGDQEVVLVRAANLALRHGGSAKRFVLCFEVSPIGVIFGEPARVRAWAKAVGMLVSDDD